MKQTFLYHHLGLGDHLILNGLVRHLAESYDKIYIFTKTVNIKNVRNLYKDNPVIKPLPYNNDVQIREFMHMFPMHNYIVIGHTPQFFAELDSPDNIKLFDEMFYESQKIPFEYKWDKFYFERDIEREKEVFYDIYGLKDDSEFIFIHESKERPVYKEVPSDIQVIRPDNKDVGIFEYLYLIEKAKEVHVMNSSFMNLIDCIQLRNDGLFYHEYSRPGINANLKLNWKVLK